MEQTLAEKESTILSLIILNEGGSCGQKDGTSLETVEIGIDGEQLSNEQKVDKAEVFGLSCYSEDTQVEEFVLGNEPIGQIEIIIPELHDADAVWLSLMVKCTFLPAENRVHGYIDGEKEFLRFWETFQSATLSSFPIRSSDKFYIDSSPSHENAVCGRVLKGSPRWSRAPLVPYDGVPFVMMARKNFGCRLGKGRPPRSNGHVDGIPARKRSRPNTSSVKVGCPAEADVLQVWRVPALRLPKSFSSKRERRRLMNEHLGRIFEHIAREDFEVRHYVSMPLIQSHSNHPVLQPDSGQFKVLHPKVIEKIYDLVLQGIFNMKVVRLMLEEFVDEYKREMDIEIQPSDRSFYPSDKDIMNHIRNAMRSVKPDPRPGACSDTEKLNTQEHPGEYEIGLSCKVRQECPQKVTGLSGGTLRADVSSVDSAKNTIYNSTSRDSRSELRTVREKSAKVSAAGGKYASDCSQGEFSLNNQDNSKKCQSERSDATNSNANSSHCNDECRAEGDIRDRRTYSAASIHQHAVNDGICRDSSSAVDASRNSHGPSTVNLSGGNRICGPQETITDVLARTLSSSCVESSMSSSNQAQTPLAFVDGSADSDRYSSALNRSVLDADKLLQYINNVKNIPETAAAVQTLLFPEVVSINIGADDVSLSPSTYSSTASGGALESQLTLRNVDRRPSVPAIRVRNRQPSNLPRCPSRRDHPLSKAAASRKVSMNTLLRDEIRSSLVSLEHLVDGLQDEVKLKCALKRLKCIERYIKGPQAIFLRRSRVQGVQSMLSAVKSGSKLDDRIEMDNFD